MLKSMPSAFVSRISRHVILTEAERIALTHLEGSSIQRLRRENVFTSDSPNDRIAIVRSGWAVSRVHSKNGKNIDTTITQIYMAGDLIGLSDIGFGQPSDNTTMQTDGTVNLIDRLAICNLAKEHPRLFAILLSLASLEATALNDRIHAITRFPAEERLMHFLLTIKSKSEQINDHISERFYLPFSQKDIGDALGLTDIYINRLLRGFQKSGQLSIIRPNVAITDRAGWEERLNFKDRYATLDVSWAS